ncbi:zinc finger protein 728-like [Lutzomyia longipalpis]|uniref:zinc finger protein 728-like n=1 Tax=Lutzomyia longipalpis TaxID=7200 RepID=UPI002483F91A|nr:zinc finger protein 728-like [Lutzomyia longipalpis]
MKYSRLGIKLIVAESKRKNNNIDNLQLKNSRMDYQQLEKSSVCRFCLKKLTKSKKNDMKDEILVSLNSIFNLEIYDEDIWPKQVCVCCKEKSKNCVAFFKKIKEGEAKLLDLFGEKFQDIKKEIVFPEEMEGEVKHEYFEEVETKFPEDDIKGVQDPKLLDKLNQSFEEDDEYSKSPSWAPSFDEEKDDSEEVEVKQNKYENNFKKKEATKRMTVLKTNNDMVKKYLGFKCDICSTKAKSYFALKHHFLDSHGVKGYMMCCSKKFTCLGKLASHVKFHLNPEAFKCVKCSKVFRRLETYRIHVRECSPNPETFTIICEICSEAFPTPRLLYQHRRKEHLKEEDKAHKCPDCPKRFLMPSELKYHRMLTHEKKKSFMCDMCGTGFSCPSKVEEHLKKTHLKDQQPKLQCKHCGRSFIEIHLKDHLTRCNVEPVTCKICGKLYKNSHAMKSHIKFVHRREGRKTYSCEICPKTFSTKRKLTDHTAKHQGILLHQCNFCDAKFYSLSTKTAHHRAVHPIENAAAKKLKPV